MNNKFVFLILTIITTVSFAEGGSSTAGTGNPASANCLKLGGTLSIIDSSDGQYGICHIEQWSLYRQMSARNLVKPLPPMEPGIPAMPNPAAVNCEQSGGASRIVDSGTGQFGVCDIEEWTLFRVINIVF